jgi:hypothetical protein
MKISELTYEQVGRDLFAPPICAGGCGWSANWHYRGIKAGGQMHWSRKGMRRSGLHAFVRAYLQEYMNWEYVYRASVDADQLILSRYGIKIPASASKWERREVLAQIERLERRLRTEHPSIYAWATYEGAK